MCEAIISIVFYANDCVLINADPSYLAFPNLASTWGADQLPQPPLCGGGEVEKSFFAIIVIYSYIWSFSLAFL